MWLQQQRAFDLHAGDELGALGLVGSVLLLAPLHVLGVGLGVVRPALALEKVLDLGHVVLNEHLALLRGRAVLRGGVVDGELLGRRRRRYDGGWQWCVDAEDEGYMAA